VLADVNGDGTSDIVVTNQSDDNVAVLLNDGLGNFEAPRQLLHRFGAERRGRSGRQWRRQAGCRHTANAGSFAGGYAIGVLLGNGDGNFQAPQSFYSGFATSSVVIGDVNSDGRPDVIAGNFQGANVSMFLGNGDGTFQNRVTFNTGTYPSSLALADVNGDGLADPDCFESK